LRFCFRDGNTPPHAEPTHSSYSVVAMALAVGTRLGSCEVLGPIGAGGMGEVYRARDLTHPTDSAS